MRPATSALTGMVSAQSQYPEVAYLLLQWLGSARIYSWMTANPGGYFDPFSLNDFADPLVRETYHAYHMDVVRETVARTVPSINYPGATAFHNALDENLMASLTGAKTAAQAMADTADAWAKITRRTGRTRRRSALQLAKLLLENLIAVLQFLILTGQLAQLVGQPVDFHLGITLRIALGIAAVLRTTAELRERLHRQRERRDGHERAG